MRTTVTLEDDVAVRLNRLRMERSTGFKETINHALRIGLEQIERAENEKRRHVRLTEPISLGRCLIGDIANTAEVLAIAEGEDFR